MRGLRNDLVNLWLKRNGIKVSNEKALLSCLHLYLFASVTSADIAFGNSGW